MKDIIDRHERIALQLSGGKDSLACLYLMREFLDRITVYWVNTGAAYPETLETIASVRSMAPRFVEIDGRQPDVIAAFGIPSDVVPVSATAFGAAASGSSAPIIQDRYHCCFQTIMRPMHERMLADGITLIIRGQRADDRLKAPLMSGAVENGIEMLFPIEGWDEERVMQFLKDQGAPIPRFYEMLAESPDCMTCSAYWEKGEAQYLKRYHSAEYDEVQRRLDIIGAAVGPHIAEFNKEIS